VSLLDSVPHTSPANHSIHSVFISHLTNSNGCGNLQSKVLLTVSPFRSSFSPQPGVFSRRFNFSGQPRRVSHAVSCYCALLNSLAALFATPILCFQWLAASFRKTPRGMGIPDGSAGPFGMPTPLLPNHIPATPVVSCNYALFRATARSYPSSSQRLPHSFYRHGGGTLNQLRLPKSRLRLSLCPLCLCGNPSSFPFWLACAQAVGGPRMITHETR
jgi:hypothetical protein